MKKIGLVETNAKVKTIKVSGIYAGDCKWVSDAVVVNEFKNAELLIFPGGGDINPALYGEPEGKNTWFSKASDERQIEVYTNNVGKTKLFGICRGLQLLHVMAGGKLVQDIDHSHHGLITYDGLSLPSNTLHHQQVMFEGMIEGEDYKLLAWSDITSPYHMDGRDKNYNFGPNYKDPEVVYYPKIGAIGIQGHPEMMSENSPTLRWLNTQIRKYLFNEK